MAVVIGALRAPEMLARGGLTYEVAGPGGIVNALSLQFLGIHLSSVIGPLVAGQLLHGPGDGALFPGLAAAVIAGAIGVLRIPRRPVAAATGRHAEA
ncbi:MAG: hypothetical protein FJ318_08055 [SAR202 cluster bacterium]|nr:hypothetical protein [SAR202 cluster bacterium]